MGKSMAAATVIAGTSITAGGRGAMAPRPSRMPESGGPIASKALQDARLLHQLQRTIQIIQVAEVDVRGVNLRHWQYARVGRDTLDHGVFEGLLSEVALRSIGKQILYERLCGFLVFGRGKDACAGHVHQRSNVALLKVVVASGKRLSFLFQLSK